MFRNVWRLWSKALGEKAHRKDQIADQIALIRTLIFTTYLITNCFIVAGVIRHWNDETAVIIEIHEEQPSVPLTKVEYNRVGEFE